LGQQEDARLAFEEAAAIDPGDAEARYLLGSLYLSQRKPQDAFPQLESAVELEPLAVSFRLNLATAYAALDRRREATQELDTVDRLQPGLPQVAELRAILARKKESRGEINETAVGTLGYAAMFEQFAPNDLLKWSRMAEDAGFGSVMA